MSEFTIADAKRIKEDYDIVEDGVLSSLYASCITDIKHAAETGQPCVFMNRPLPQPILNKLCRVGFTVEIDYQHKNNVTIHGWA